MLLFPAVLYSALALVLGLLTVTWGLARLPLWFHGYALSAGFLGSVADHLSGLDQARRPLWQRLGGRVLGQS